jgi:hypothetical protein
MRSTHAACSSAVAFLFACGGPVSEAGTDGSSESSTSDSTTMTMTSATTDPTTSATTASTSSTTTDTTTTASTTDDTTTTTETTDPDTSGTSDPSTETTDPDTSATGSESTSAATTGEPAEEYPACAQDDECEDPYSLCWPPEQFGTPNFCTLPCESAKECPVPTTGEAVPVCEGPPDQDICVLDCTDGECPDGMTCVDVFNDGNFLRCTRDA